MEAFIVLKYNYVLLKYRNFDWIFVDFIMNFYNFFTANMFYKRSVKFALFSPHFLRLNFYNEVKLTRQDC